MIAAYPGRSQILTVTSLGVALLLLMTAPAAGQEAERLEDGAPSIWYDGDRARKVWPHPRLLAEFGDARAEAPDFGDLAPEGVELYYSRRFVRIWRLAPGSPHPGRCVEALRQRHPHRRFSPLFTESPEGGRLRALPGGVVVCLPREWEQTRVDSWAADRGLTIVRTLPALTNVFLVEAPAGAPSLQLANQLYLSGEVEAALPNWWLDMAPR